MRKETRATEIARRQGRQPCGVKRLSVLRVIGPCPSSFDARDVGEISQTARRLEPPDEIGEPVAIFEEQRRRRFAQSGVGPCHAGKELFADQLPHDREAFCQRCRQSDMDVVAIDGEACGVGSAPGGSDALRQGAGRIEQRFGKGCLAAQRNSSMPPGAKDCAATPPPRAPRPRARPRRRGSENPARHCPIRPA